MPRLKKRPCRICRKWFTPDPRVGDRQKTCGNPECMKKWHAKKCAEWNRKNRTCAQENYLYEKLARATKQSYGGKKALPADAPVKPPPAFFPQLPRCLIQEVMGVQQFVIIEHISHQLFKAVQEVISIQHAENTRAPSRLLH
nr:hypothetical protein [uncultured Desulfobulbus sp.]